MKKVAILLFGCTVSVYADVMLYGRVAAAVENDQFPSNTQARPGTTSIQDYGSYFGIRGTDQVYGQTAAIWQIEQFLNISSGTAFQGTTGSAWAPGHPYGGTNSTGVNTSGVNVLASSDSYIGLQGAWGRVRLGNLSNTFRTNTGAVDMYNGANANILGTYDRFIQVNPATVRYDSPSWANLSFSTFMSFNQDGSLNTGGLNGNGINQAVGLNGYNNAPVIGWGVFYMPNNFSVTWNNQIEMNTGVFQTIQNGGSSGGLTPTGGVSNQPINAWVSRLELGYNDPDSWFAGIGGQIAQGFGYQGVPGNGNMQNLWVQQGATGGINQYINSTTCKNGWCAMNQAVLSTAEIGASFGWHVENWTPKIGYVYGANMMTGGSAFDIISGSNQMNGTGYQQVIVELDWNITPRTIAFVNWGQIWWGDTLQNTVKGTNPAANAPINMAQAGGSMNVNNATTAVGFSHTF